jgi:hypothetical protein
MTNLKELIQNTPVEELFKSRSEIEGLVNLRIAEAVKEVEVEPSTGRDVKSRMLTYQGVKVIVKPAAYMGRLRAFQAVPKGKGTGYKAGRLIIKEYDGPFKELAKALRFNSLPYVDFKDTTTWPKD